MIIISCYCTLHTDKCQIKELLQKICRSSHDGKAGNPVIFHERYVPELLRIEGDKGGKSVVNQHLEDVFLFGIPDAMELKDIDRKS